VVFDLFVNGLDVFAKCGGTGAFVITIRALVIVDLIVDLFDVFAEITS
jgi:hypothetical protein